MGRKRRRIRRNYEVESIVSHRYDGNKNLIYRVRWIGFGPDQDTSEPEDHLAGAPKALQMYWSNQVHHVQDTIEQQEEEEEVGLDFPLPDTDWNAEIAEFLGVVEGTESTPYQLYIGWKNGARTLHTREEVREKCPMKLLDYFEQRSRLLPNNDD
jgi:hypothetical protein